MASDHNDQGMTAMEISTLSTRPQAPPAPPALVVSSQAERVRTDLPEARTVTAVPPVSQTPPRSENNQAAQAGSTASPPPNRGDADLQDRTRRQTVLDWSTNQPVFRVVDERSGQTISQTPDQALLRLRAYARQQNLAAADKGQNPAA